MSIYFCPDFREIDPEKVAQIIFPNGTGSVNEMNFSKSLIEDNKVNFLNIEELEKIVSATDIEGICPSDYDDGKCINWDMFFKDRDKKVKEIVKNIMKDAKNQNKCIVEIDSGFDITLQIFDVEVNTIEEIEFGRKKYL